MIPFGVGRSTSNRCSMQPSWGMVRNRVVRRQSLSSATKPSEINCRRRLARIPVPQSLLAELVSFGPSDTAMRSREELTSEATLRIGSVLAGKWHLDALLGVGGSAAVFAATHKNRSRVAIKLMHRHLARHERQVERFLREGYVANSVDHAAVVRIFDDGIDEGQPFLVIELLRGTTLEELRRARGGQLPFVELVAHLGELLDTLAIAHRAGVLHRDIKPSNLFVTESGALRVLDFGLATPADEDMPTEDLSDSGAGDGDGPIGTAGYMAPEQAAARSDLVDARTDLWAVGATALWMVSGRFVHDAKTTQELIARVATQPVRPVRELAPALAPDAARWVDRALTFSRSERFQSAQEMAAGLRAIDQGAANGSAVGEPQRPRVAAAAATVGPAGARRRTRSVQLLALGLVMGALALALVVASREDTARSPASPSAWLADAHASGPVPLVLETVGDSAPTMPLGTATASPPGVAATSRTSSTSNSKPHASASGTSSVSSPPHDPLDRRL